MSQINPHGIQEPVDPQFFIAKYLSPILEHKWIVLACTLLGLFIAVPISFLVEPQYSSTAITQLETPRAQMISKVTEEISSQKGDTAFITAAVERMHSSMFKTEVLKIIPKRLQIDLETPLTIQGQLKNKLKPMVKKLLNMETDPALSASTAITPARLDKLSKRVEILGNPKRGTIQITGTTFAQDMTTVLVQSYLDVWVALNMEANKSLIRHELDFTQSQKDDYFLKLKDAEKELRSFKQIFEIPPALSSVTDMELQSQLDVLQNKVTNAKERYKRIDDIFLDLSRKEKSVVNNIKILNPPQVPIDPSKNMQPQIILIGLLLGAAIAIGPILAIDYFKGNIRHKKDIANAVNIPIIGRLPIIK
jgi:uncharacterized protein involved in exopolysaccharide biosynthesis